MLGYYYLPSEVGSDLQTCFDVEVEVGGSLVCLSVYVGQSPKNQSHFNIQHAYSTIKHPVEETIPTSVL